MLILCRGFFTPVAKQANDSSVENHVFDAAFVPAAGGQPLADSFAEVSASSFSSSALVSAF